ncbi:hypothetical protein [Streptomyces sp. V1I6]|uniref:hypothetical protein n=1 Tax=Streptomyces sp. V1I6 TaxID=3042273 RepID=UPI0027883698|nr:hypothetical protein [Streptomyces sp. V1I6]MDQ0846269.1 hypothetical protein [Streptomyces sp. V1I6]
MRHGQQHPEGGQHPRHPQPGPYGSPGGPQQPWDMPTQPAGPAASVRERRGPAAVVAVVAAAVVVVAAAVTGYLALGGDGDDRAHPPVPASSAPAADDARTDAGEQPTVPGWRTVTNPRTGIVFDVPPEWSLKPTSWASYVADEGDPEEIPLVGFSAPAMLKEKWCVFDADLDGSSDETWLAAAGSRGERGARTPQEAARDNASLWVYGGYTQPDKAKVTRGAAQPYTTASGITGSVATASSTGVEPDGKCDTDGKATAFAFKNPKGDIVSWTFVGAKGVGDEVPDGVVRKVLSTVRLAGG